MFHQMFLIFINNRRYDKLIMFLTFNKRFYLLSFVSQDLPLIYENLRKNSISSIEMMATSYKII